MTPLSREYTFISSLPAGIEIAIPSICKPGDVTHVVISRETERFVNEKHTHEARKIQ